MKDLKSIEKKRVGGARQTGKAWHENKSREDKNGQGRKNCEKTGRQAAGKRNKVKSKNKGWKGNRKVGKSSGNSGDKTNKKQGNEKQGQNKRLKDGKRREAKGEKHREVGRRVAVESSKGDGSEEH